MRMYFIALVLPEELNIQVKAMKEYMREMYGCKVALRSPAHITLIPPFWMDESLQEMLSASLDEVAERFGDFSIEQNGFSCFSQKTIFIASAPNDSLSRLHKNVNDFFREQAAFPMKFDDRPFHPHVTIATRDLTKKAYQEAWAHFKNKKFTKTWSCTGLSLLQLGDNGWRIIHNSPFHS
jgi:2'-5' RNA ligase